MQTSVPTIVATDPRGSRGKGPRDKAGPNPKIPARFCVASFSSGETGANRRPHRHRRRLTEISCRFPFRFREES